MNPFTFGQKVAGFIGTQKRAEGFAGSRSGRPGDAGWGNIQVGQSYQLPNVNPQTHYSDGTPRPGVNLPAVPSQPTTSTPAPQPPSMPPAAQTPAPAPAPAQQPPQASKPFDPLDPGLDNIMGAFKWLYNKMPPLRSPTSSGPASPPSPMMGRGGVGVGYSRPAYVPDMSQTSGTGAVAK